MQTPTMKIQVLFFAVFKERLGRNEDEITLPHGATVEGALAVLRDRYTDFAAVRTKFQVAVNEEMVDTDWQLKDGDTLALIPPVSGGCGPKRHILLTEAPLSLQRAIDSVTSVKHGAIATFTGTVRDHSKGKDVIRLEYEAYKTMVEKVFHELVLEIEAEFAGVQVAVEHRVGVLGLGDAAVVIAAGSPHRKEAFLACEAMIDRLKERSPIWKKEVSPDGQEWVGLGP